MGIACVIKLTISPTFVIDGDKRFGAQHHIDWMGEPRRHERIVAQLPLLDLKLSHLKKRF